MSQEVYTGYPATFAYGEAGGSTLSLPQLRGVDKSTGKALMEVIAAGSLDRAAVILSHADPRVGITSADLAAIVGGISPSVGLKITGTALFQLQQAENAGTFTGADANILVTNSVGGFLSIGSISARQDDNNTGASAELLYYPHSSDGLTAPLALATGQDLTGAPAFGSQFFLGPAYYDSSELEGLLASEVQFGIEYAVIRGSGDVFARKGRIKRRRPIIRLTFDKLSNVVTSGLFSGSLAGDTLAVYYRKGVHGGSRVADATAQHVKISCTAGEWGTDNISWSDDEDGNAVLTVLPTGTLAGSAASAIP